jgi:hypothetical protein
MAVQVTPIISTVKAPGTKRLKLECDEPLSNVAFNVNLRRYSVDAAGKSRVYGDLYRYDVDKNKWSLVQSPNAPPPRSAHQAVCAGGDTCMCMCSPGHPPQSSLEPRLTI